MEHLNIRPLMPEHREIVFSMMRPFFSSDAVEKSPEDAVLYRSIDDCIGPCPYLSGYLLEWDGEPAGYGMIVLGYSTENGGLCLMVEDLYIKPEFRCLGIGTSFLQFLEREFPQAVCLKLEVEEDNPGAIACYQRQGYRKLAYHIMCREEPGTPV